MIGRSRGNECSYRFNRRFEPHSLFDRIATAVMACPVFTYSDITGKQEPGHALHEVAAP